MDEIEEIMHLPPEERIKKLKEREEKIQKEKEETEKLLKSSLEEAEDKAEKKKEIPIPQLTSITEEGLSPEEKEILHTKQFTGSSPLEESLRGVEGIPPDQLDYSKKLAMEPMQDLYKEITKIKDYITEEYNTEQNINNLYNVQKAIEQKRKDIKNGNYNTTNEIMSQLDTATRIANDIMEKYKK